MYKTKAVALMLTTQHTNFILLSWQAPVSLLFFLSSFPCWISPCWVTCYCGRLCQAKTDFI